MSRSHFSGRKATFFAVAGVAVWEILHSLGFAMFGWVAHDFLHSKSLDGYVPKSQCFQPACVTRQDDGRTFRLSADTVVECHWSFERGGEWLRTYYADAPEAFWGVRERGHQ